MLRDYRSGSAVPLATEIMETELEFFDYLRSPANR